MAHYLSNTKRRLTMKKPVVPFFAAIIVFSNLLDIASSKDFNPGEYHSTLPGVVVARLKPGVSTTDLLSNASELASAIAFNQAFPFHSKAATLSRIYYIHFDPSIPAEEFSAELSQWGVFDYVEPKYISFVCRTTPNDSLLSRQLHLAQIEMFNAWDLQQGSAQITIAIVDNGTDYMHPDLFENIWINPIEAPGRPGIDDDGNGYIDDLHGWDFGENDNDPTFGKDEASIAAHGTHTAGIAAAVTNNGIGVAGVGWYCTILPVKVGPDDDAYQITHGYEGIVYAADRGAHVINNSWGRRGVYSLFEQDVINYAVSKGCIIVAAAGNSNTEVDFWPAAYVHVIGVAAVNELDEKASYSNYGRFIDISAPGGDLRIGHPGILSTFPVMRGSYGEMSGTSMASPVVAGVMGLLKNEFPNWKLLQLTRQIVMTADRIDDFNEDYRGLIGHGRLNAFRALTEQVQEEEPAKVALFKISVNDSVWGDGNFLFERNETIGVDAWYRNYAVSPGRNLELQLTSDDNDLIISTSRALLSEVPPDSIFAIRGWLNFRIKSQATPHLAQLILKYSLDNGDGGIDTLWTIIGKSAILFVDDDENDSRNVDGFYTMVLDQLDVSYLKWNHAQFGTPPAKAMAYFPMIIWCCEWAFPSLTPADRLALQYYLDQNGSLFISGQDIGWALADPASDEYSDSSVRFYQDYLHSIYRADQSGSQTVIGVPGSIGQGMKFDIYQPQISVHFQFPEWIEPAPDARLAFQYENGKGAGISFNGDHRVLNLGFGFEAVDAREDEQPGRFSRDRTELMGRILNQLGPIRHRPLADREMAGEPILFAADLSPQIYDLQSLVLGWKTDSLSDFSELPMQAIGSNHFEQTLDLKSFAGRVQYYFVAKTLYYQFTLPVAGKNKPYSFYIGRDLAPPEFFHIALKDIFIQNYPRTVQVSVQDNIGVENASVWLHYRADAEADSVVMIFRGDDLYQATIPAMGGFGDSIRYYFSATDLAQIPNRAPSPEFSYQIGIEGFEYGLDGWIADSIGWAIDGQEAHSGLYCVSSFPDQNYPDKIDIHLNSRWGLKRSQLQGMELSFWTKHQLEEYRDFGSVEISVNYGADWQMIGSPITGIIENWYQVSYDLSGFYRPGQDTLLLRFRMTSDSSQIQPLSGWFIDDIAIRTKNPSAIFENSSPASFSILALQVRTNAPNPFNSITQIQYRISIPGEVTFEIFNLLGQSVFRQSPGYQAAGKYELIWNGTDSKRQQCESGIYFGRLTVKSDQSGSMKRLSKTIKMTYLK